MATVETYYSEIMCMWRRDEFLGALLMEARRRHCIPLGLKLQVAVRCSMRVLGTKLRATMRTLCPLNRC